MRLNREIGFVLILAMAFANPGRAVQIEPGMTYNTTAPTGTNVPNWDTGWAQPAGEPEGTNVTGWDYVGQVNGLSGTYLGDGWVLTAAHVGAGNLTLDGQTYDVLSNTTQDIYATSNQVDLVLFQVDTTSTTGATLDLPALTISTNDPTAFAYGTTGSSVVMIGYGGGSKSWGLNTVTLVNYTTPVSAGGHNYVSNDFFTYTGTTTYGNESVTNDAQLVSGDSGGGDFIYNAATGQWELAGINEVKGTFTNNQDETQNLSGFVQLDTYEPQIEADITAVPEPPAPLLLGFGLVLLWGVKRLRRRLGAPTASKGTCCQLV
ncbi:MAG: serine protease [Methylacidiphilales bacterium]|nr:serine protease [Candidatus Methylacidiphilales bacterium]